MSEDRKYRSCQSVFCSSNDDSYASSYNPTYESDVDQNCNINKSYQPLYSKSNTKLLPKCSKNFSIDLKQTEKIYTHKQSLNAKLPPRYVSPRGSCSSCASYIQKIKSFEKKFQILTEKYIISERNLKQYDDLLQIKDNRLAQQEKTLDDDAKILEIEKEKIFKLKNKIEDDKLALNKEKELIACENQKILKIFEEINRKKQEIQDLINDYEIKNQELIIRERNQIQLEKDFKERKILNRKDDLMRLLEQEKAYKKFSKSLVLTEVDDPSLSEKKLKIKRKKEELNSMAQGLFEIKAKIEAEKKKNSEDFEKKMKILWEQQTSLDNQNKSIEETQERINEEIESIEQLKSVLLSQEENLEREKKLFQDTYDQKLLDLEQEKSLFKEFYEEKIFELEKQLQLLKVSKRTTGTKDAVPDEDIYFLSMGEMSFGPSMDNQKFKEYEAKNISLKKDIEYLENKLKIVECSREQFESDNFELQEKIRKLNKKKSILKDKMEDLQRILQTDETGVRTELESLSKDFYALKAKNNELEASVRSLKQQISILNLKNEELEMNNKDLAKGIDNTMNNTSINNLEQTLELPSGPYEIKNLFEELQSKLDQVRIREKELNAIEKELAKEKKSMEVAADYIKTINEELETQRSSFEKEKNLFQEQKNMLIETDKKQQEKAELLIKNENELQLASQKIAEREKFVLIKERKIIIPKLQGLDKFIFES